jgi:hypothetical protein
MAQQTPNKVTKVITGEVRFSYEHVFKPEAIDDGEPKYSVSIIIPKKDKATIAKIEAAIDSAIEAGKAKLENKAGKVNKTQIKLPLRDGDEEREGDDAYKNSYFINASSKNKPGVVDADLQPILDTTEFYSGCFGRASINFYAFDAKGNKGIAAGLNNVQKLRDVEYLVGRASAEDDFGSDDDDLLG